MDASVASEKHAKELDFSAKNVELAKVEALLSGSDTPAASKRTEGEVVCAWGWPSARLGSMSDPEAVPREAEGASGGTGASFTLSLASTPSNSQRLLPVCLLLSSNLAIKVLSQIAKSQRSSLQPPSNT